MRSRTCRSGTEQRQNKHVSNTPTCAAEAWKKYAGENDGYDVTSWRLHLPTYQAMVTEPEAVPGDNSVPGDAPVEARGRSRSPRSKLMISTLKRMEASVEQAFVVLPQM